MRLAAAPLLLLGACGQAEAPANNVAATKAPVVEGDVGAAQRLVRERLGAAGQGITFSQPLRSRAEGVTIICGAFTKNGVSRRYVVVDSTDAFIEPEQDMDQAFREFCVQGAQRPAQPAPPVVENAA